VLQPGVGSWHYSKEIFMKKQVKKLALVKETVGELEVEKLKALYGGLDPSYNVCSQIHC
jgi:hypothetical protein